MPGGHGEARGAARVQRERESQDKIVVIPLPPAGERLVAILGYLHPKHFEFLRERPGQRQLFGDLIDSSEAERWRKDAKTELQEWLQARKLPVPTYRIVATRGQAHAQTFDVECAVPALGLAELGEGRSRRIAEQEAARCMLDKLKASDRPGGPLRA